MSNTEINLAQDLETSHRPSIRSVEAPPPSPLEQLRKMEKIGDALEEQVRMKLVELEHSFRKGVTEMTLSHKRSLQAMFSRYRAEADELESILKKLR